jgi:L-fuconolactonase
MRLDSHQHFWNYSRDAADYVWMTDELAPLKRNFEPEDLQPLLQEAGFDGAVTVQARETVSETEYLLGLAAAHPIVRGVVGWVDLCDPMVERDIERFSDNPTLKGFRMLIHDRADPDFADSEPHRRGVSMLKRYGLTYDLLLRPPHIASATRLVDALPEQPFVVDHIAKPLIAKGEFSPWHEDLTALSRRPNVLCKLSGLVTEADWDNWTPDQIRPYLDVVLDLFGPERLMIGSDWPVCTVAAEYGEVMSLVVDWTDRLSADERDAVLGGNCARFYNIAQP